MKNLLLLALVFTLFSCKKTPKQDMKPIHLVTLDPGHFHAALVQKSMYDSIDAMVYVYKRIR